MLFERIDMATALTPYGNILAVQNDTRLLERFEVEKRSLISCGSPGLVFDLSKS